MRSIILLSTFLFACRVDSKDTSDNSFQPAIDETSSPDRVGTYAHRLPDSPDTVIFLGDSITAGAGSPGDDEDYVRLLVNNTINTDWDGKDLATRYQGLKWWT